MIKRMSMAAAAAALTVPLLSGIGAGPAAADPTACEPNRQFTKILSSSKVAHVTHYKGFQLPPGGSRSVTRAATKSSTVTAGVTASGEATVSANGVIASAEAKAGFSLARDKATTRQKSVSVTDTVRAKRDSRFAVWAGYREVFGSYRMYRCNSRGTESRVIASGTYRSFSPSNKDGIALCPASRYPRGSFEAKACKQAWG